MPLVWGGRLSGAMKLSSHDYRFYGLVIGHVGLGVIRRKTDQEEP